MIPASALARTDVDGFFFFKDPINISLSQAGTRRYAFRTTQTLDDKSVVDSRLKALISVGVGPYHFWHESVGQMLDLVRRKGVSLVLLDNSARLGPAEEYYQFLIRLLDKNKIDYLEIFLSDQSRVFNNIYVADISNVVVSNWSNQVYDFTKLVDHGSSKKKVYLSRAGRGVSFTNINPGLYFNHDVRIIDEPVLEEFLVSKGYEVVVPEELGSYEDQVKYFNTVGTMCSVSGSALANSIFMPPGGRVLEIVTSLILPLNKDIEKRMDDGLESLQYYYDLISYEKGHIHIRIPNSTRMSSDIIEVMEDSIINV